MLRSQASGITLSIATAVFLTISTVSAGTAHAQVFQASPDVPSLQTRQEQITASHNEAVLDSYVEKKVDAVLTPMVSRLIRKHEGNRHWKEAGQEVSALGNEGTIKVIRDGDRVQVFGHVGKLEILHWYDVSGREPRLTGADDIDPVGGVYGWGAPPPKHLNRHERRAHEFRERHERRPMRYYNDYSDQRIQQTPPVQMQERTPMPVRQYRTPRQQSMLGSAARNAGTNMFYGVTGVATNAANMALQNALNKALGNKY